MVADGVRLAVVTRDVSTREVTGELSQRSDGRWAVGATDLVYV
jgi:hypothetical protein